TRTGPTGPVLVAHITQASQRTQVDLHAAVLRATFGSVVAGDRLAGANATAADARTGYAPVGQVGSHAGSTVLGRAHVQFQRTCAVGVTDDVDAVLVELLEHLDQGIQGRIETAGNIRRAAGKGDVARHDQLQVVTITHHLHTGTGQLLTQTLLLAVHIVAVPATRGATDRSTDQGSLGAVLLAGGSGSDYRAGHGAGPTVDAGLACLTLAGIGVVGTASQQRHTGGSGNQCFDVHTLFLGSQLIVTAAPGRRNALRRGLDRTSRYFLPLLQLWLIHPRIKGFSRISSPMRVSGPCPVTTTASSSRVYSRWRIE